MTAREVDLVRILKSELAFIEKGGYRHTARAAWRPQFMFQDSPICLNFDPLADRRPCSECVLMQFVPEDARARKIPCRYILLNEREETVEAFYGSGTYEELEAAVKAWLKATIARLEGERVEGSPSTDSPICAKAKFAAG